MPKQSAVMQDPTVQKAIEKAKERLEHQRIDEAKATLVQYENEYEHAKEVFFKVNGARRIVKNSEK